MLTLNEHSDIRAQYPAVSHIVRLPIVACRRCDGRRGGLPSIVDTQQRTHHSLGLVSNMHSTLVSVCACACLRSVRSHRHSTSLCGSQHSVSQPGSLSDSKSTAAAVDADWHGVGSGSSVSGRVVTVIWDFRYDVAQHNLTVCIVSIVGSSAFGISNVYVSVRTVN